MNDLEKYIGYYFDSIKEEEIGILSGFFQTESLVKGNYFVQQGKVCDRLSFVKSGWIRVYADTESKEVTQWICTPGYFVTELSSLIFGKPARFHIQALTDCTLFTLHKDQYDRMGEEMAGWHLLEKMLIAKCFTFMEDRIFTHLSLSAEERYQHFFDHNRELFNQVPLQYIASMLGMSPETFSRIRKKQLSK